MSMTAEALGKVDMKPNLGQPARPKHNLCYLADVMGLQLQFTDFPKVHYSSPYTLHLSCRFF